MTSKIVLCRKLKNKRKRSDLTANVKIYFVEYASFVLLFFLSYYYFRIKMEPPEWTQSEAGGFCNCPMWAIGDDRGTRVFISWKINMDSSDAARSPSVKHINSNIIIIIITVCTTTAANLNNNNQYYKHNNNSSLWSWCLKNWRFHHSDARFNLTQDEDVCPILSQEDPDLLFYVTCMFIPFLSWF